ncbi:unnamed protein product [Darwinula stevensoni]|uniref:Uncharacterized protein n=1 Tax=Darwinula stevensoni TaxID=69355 RepID=A0A7R9A5W4_9CRUS|nr:unnamed protein product [Darwinula stevensoni]CAG0887355.1 unnamed protein product [Darwinula stevensoni]
MTEIYDLVVERYKAGNRPVDLMKELKNLKVTPNMAQGCEKEDHPHARDNQEQRNKIAFNPHRSFRKMAKEAVIDPKTVWDILHEDLGTKSYSIQKRQLLTDVQKQKRLDCSRKLLSRLKKGYLSKFVLTDEKLLIVEAVQNLRNNRVVAKNIKAIPGNEKFHLKGKHPAGIMVWAEISTSRKTSLVFIPPGVKIRMKEFGDHTSSETQVFLRDVFKAEWETMLGNSENCGLAVRLLKSGILTQRDFDEIMVPRKQNDRNIILFMKLPARVTSDNFQDFLKVLENAGQNDICGKLLAQSSSETQVFLRDVFKAEWETMLGNSENCGLAVRLLKSGILTQRDFDEIMVPRKQNDRNIILFMKLPARVTSDNFQDFLKVLENAGQNDICGKLLAQ